MDHRLTQLIGALVVLLGIAQARPLHAQEQKRKPLTAALVSAALAGAGLHADADHIDLPTMSIAAESEPQLLLLGAELLPDGRLRIRLACKQNACQPFLAIVRPLTTQQGLVQLASVQRGAQALLPQQPADKAGRLLAGQHATLLLENAHMRITVPVLAIDSGATGTEVRVSSLDRKQTFRATVTGAGTVRGTLP